MTRKEALGKLALMFRQGKPERDIEVEAQGLASQLRQTGAAVVSLVYLIEDARVVAMLTDASMPLGWPNKKWAGKVWRGSMYAGYRYMHASDGWVNWTLTEDDLLAVHGALPNRSQVLITLEIVKPYPEGGYSSDFPSPWSHNKVNRALQLLKKAGMVRFDGYREGKTHWVRGGTAP